MVLVDAVARQVPGVVGNEGSPGADSFATGLLDWPHYTRPEVYRDFAVPPVLLSGHHAQVAEWRRQQALLLTYRRRPDLLSEEQREEAERLSGTAED
jgi:tRNA (guanine37-N1)-methyltransferase